MRARLTREEIVAAARQLGCEAAALRAVLAVESRERGFLNDDKPVVLFERHWFHRLTRGAYAEQWDISNLRAGGYATGPSFEARGQAEWARMMRAAKLDWDAAMMSASWGLPQLMGFNFGACGCVSIDQFVERMQQNEAAQLGLLVEFLKSRGLADELQRRDWELFARIYNGPAFRQNKYDEKLAAMYARFSKE